MKEFYKQTKQTNVPTGLPFQYHSYTIDFLAGQIMVATVQLYHKILFVSAATVSWTWLQNTTLFF